MSTFVAIAWPGLLTLAGMLALIGWAIYDNRRRRPRGRYREPR